MRGAAFHPEQSNRLKDNLAVANLARRGKEFFTVFMPLVGAANGGESTAENALATASLFCYSPPPHISLEILS
ncbi:MAG: hypothetical protein ACQESR_17285 [Planctomycetota bacterium]